MINKTTTEIIKSNIGQGKILSYTAINKDENIIKFITENKNELSNKIKEFGGVLLRGFSIRSISEFNEVAKSYCNVLFDYVNRSTPRTRLGQKIYTATEYPANRTIPFHNENSYSLSWPNIILFFAVIVATEGGETPIADSRLVYKNIDSKIIDKFNSKKLLYVRNFNPGIDLSWQEVFQTESKDEVEEYCKNNNIEFEWKEGTTELTTKQVCQATLKHPETGEDVWFNQAHLFHFSALNIEEQQQLLQILQKHQVPRNVFYGDGSEIEEEFLREIRDAYEKERIQFKWNKSDVMILDNRLMTHARNSFVGERKIAVAMGN